MSENTTRWSDVVALADSEELDAPSAGDDLTMGGFAEVRDLSGTPEGIAAHRRGLHRAIDAAIDAGHLSQGWRAVIISALDGSHGEVVRFKLTVQALAAAWRLRGQRDAACEASVTPPARPA